MPQRWRTRLASYVHCATLAFILCCIPAQAKDNDPLQVFLNGLTGFQARFTQTLYNDQNRVLERAQGVLYMRIPKKFLWIYQQPYEQHIVSDGENIWVYDVDLEQVIAHSAEAFYDAAPSAILSGDTKRLELHFIKRTITDENEDGLLWMELLPRSQDSAYSWIRLGFSAERLAMMILKDSIGQTSRIDFSAVELNPDIPDEYFTFQIPDGVDVIDERL
ncbi:MAG: outer membrane lipoprotein chaperone LolA [Candidatus Eutrophobiaceae bacterium]